jgi:hypothetical protein
VWRTDGAITSTTQRHTPEKLYVWGGGGEGTREAGLKRMQPVGTLLLPGESEHSCTRPHTETTHKCSWAGKPVQPQGSGDLLPNGQQAHARHTPLTNRGTDRQL